MATKSLMVLGINGAGKKTLVGNLIYKCGLELPRLEELEREGIHHYAEIASFYQSKGYDQSFHAPSGLFLVTSTMKAGQLPDFIFWVVDATNAADCTHSAEKLATSLSSGEILPREKLLILINKMDLVDWSEHVFDDVLRKFSAFEFDIDHAFIPVSGLTGDNLLSSPEKHPWLKAASHSGAERGSTQPLLYQLE